MTLSASTIAAEPRSGEGTDRLSSVLVVELDDVVPRRHPDLPNLYVGITMESPETKIERIEDGAKPKWAKGHVVRLRPDLFEGFEATTHDEAVKQKKALASELTRRGYTINANTTGTWRAYVVQLDESAISNPGRGWVYVGESSLSPEDRLLQHLAGTRNRRGPLFSKLVRDHGQYLRWDLMQGLPTLYSHADSKLAEADLAEQLREQGYVVEGGH